MELHPAILVLVGIVVISNLIRWTLNRYEKVTLGVLMGLLLGSILGIWPFQEAVQNGEPRTYFHPSVFQVAVALGLAVVGFGATVLIDRLGRKAR